MPRNYKIAAPSKVVHMVDTKCHGLRQLRIALYIATSRFQQGQGLTASARCSAPVLGRWMSARALQVLSVPDVVSSESVSRLLPSGFVWERERMCYGRETGDKRAVSHPRDLRIETLASCMGCNDGGTLSSSFLPSSYKSPQRCC